MGADYQPNVKRWLLDYDSDVVDESPPVQNDWYTVFEAEDVRLLFCAFIQDHTEAAILNVEVRWTIDGNVYLVARASNDSQIYYVRRDVYPGTLTTSTTLINAGGYADKRGLDFKVEIRLTGVPGTAQRLRCWCVRETLEET